MTLTRRGFLATSTAAVAAGTFGRVHLFGQQAPAPVTPVFKELRNNVGFWTAQGGTIGWLINPAGAVAVDSQFPNTAALCVEQLLKTSGKTEITALINTHHHGDHTGGNGVFRPKTKQIIGHANVPKYMKDGWTRTMAQRTQQSPPPTSPAPAEPTVPDKTFDTTWSMTHGDETVSAKHYGPAHTGGDAVIRFERANVAHMGDLMFNRMHPVIDRPNGASIANWIVTLQKVVGGTARRHDLHLRPRRPRLRGHRQARRPAVPRRLPRRAARIRPRSGQGRPDPRRGARVEGHHQGVRGLRSADQSSARRRVRRSVRR